MITHTERRKSTEQEKPANENPAVGNTEITREVLIDLLNEDLAREYQAAISYVVYSQVLKGPEYLHIAKELESDAHEEIGHALILSKLIDYLGGTPTSVPKPVPAATDPTEILRNDFAAETEGIRNYVERLQQCEALGEYAAAQRIRDILVDEQEHQIELASALNLDVPEAVAQVGRRR